MRERVAEVLHIRIATILLLQRREGLRYSLLGDDRTVVLLVAREGTLMVRWTRRRSGDGRFSRRDQHVRAHEPRRRDQDEKHDAQDALPPAQFHVPHHKQSADGGEARLSSGGYLTAHGFTHPCLLRLATR